MGGFLTIDTCPFIPQDKTYFSYGPGQLKIDNQQSVVVWKSLVSRYFMKINFGHFFGLLCFNNYEIICNDNANNTNSYPRDTITNDLTAGSFRVNSTNFDEISQVTVSNIAQQIHRITFVSIMKACKILGCNSE